MSDQSLPQVLLVSASALTTKSMQRLLSGQFEVVCDEQADQAWIRLQQDSRVAVVVSELSLCIDQFALLERLRHAQDKAIASLPVLLLVGENVDESQRDHAFSMGATDFITMPFSSIELKTRIRLHARMFTLFRQQEGINVDQADTSIDLLNSLMQEQHFVDRLEQELSFAQRHKTFVSVCLLQIDRHDDFDEAHGEQVLRAIIRAVARIIAAGIRREDCHAYLGGGLFALMYPVTNGLGASVATLRLLEKVEKTQIRHEGADLPVTLSAGLFAALPLENQSASDIMDTVRSRLVTAQHKGGNRIVSSKTEQEHTDISIEQALNMISYQRTDGLAKQMPQLLDTLMPLLEFAKANNEVELEGVIASLGD